MLFKLWLNLGLKAEKQLQNKNHTEDWVLGSHHCDKWPHDSLDLSLNSLIEIQCLLTMFINK